MVFCFFASRRIVLTGPSSQCSSTKSLSTVLPERKASSTAFRPSILLSWYLFSIFFSFLKSQLYQLQYPFPLLCKIQISHKGLKACSSAVVGHGRVFCHGIGLGISPSPEDSHLFFCQTGLQFFDDF